MSDDLLPYYRNELSFIRRLGAEFAEDHPRMAERLKLTGEGSADPHVERLIEAFAFLTARIRRKLDDDFPEVTQALMAVLYPHYLAPIPSMAIAQISLVREQADLVAGYNIPRGSYIDSEPTLEGPCRFRTCYDTTVFPMEVSEATLKSLSRTDDKVPRGSAGLLRIALRCWGAEVTLGKMKTSSLRFYLKGQEQHVNLMYEYLMNGALDVAVASGPHDQKPVFLGRQAIRAVGFDADEAVLPQSPRTFPGYRLLSEYFTFPRKFLFFEITGLRPELLAGSGRTPELRVYLNRSSPDLEQNVTADMFRLGCTPIINLFEKKAEPVHVNYTDTEYRVVPDTRRPSAHEVYSIESVIAVTADGAEKTFHPFYSIRHGSADTQGRVFWQATRRESSRAEAGVDHGTEVYFSFADPEFSPHESVDWVVTVETICSNRDLPARLPSGGGRPDLKMTEGGPVEVSCLSHPTATLRPSLREGALWRLISHLSLNHLSLLDGEHGPDGFKEILKLYDWASRPDTQQKIDSILSVAHRRIIARAGGVAAGGFCRGTEVTIKFDEERFADNGLFLLASVLERFLALYSTVNSFVQLVATTQFQGEVRRWSPRAGEKILL
jgi:type VI secretion system protein ImpG